LKGLQEMLYYSAMSITACKKAKLQARIKSIALCLAIISQMATYWFVIGNLSIQRAQKSEVRQATNDVIKSEV